MATEETLHVSSTTHFSTHNEPPQHIDHFHFPPYASNSFRSELFERLSKMTPNSFPVANNTHLLQQQQQQQQPLEILKNSGHYSALDNSYSPLRLNNNSSTYSPQIVSHMPFPTTPQTTPSVYHHQKSSSDSRNSENTHTNMDYHSSAADRNESSTGFALLSSAAPLPVTPKTTPTTVNCFKNLSNFRSPSNEIGDKEEEFSLRSFDNARFEHKIASITLELRRTQQALESEITKRLVVEEECDRLKMDLNSYNARLQLAPAYEGWENCSERERELLQENVILRDLVLRKICFQCGQPMNCIPCTPFPVSGLELGEGANYGYEGVCVSAVKEGGPAFSAGIVEGDLITELDGIPTANRDAFKRIMHNCLPLQPVSFVLFRESHGEDNPSSASWTKMKGQMIMGASPRYLSSGRTFHHILEDGFKKEAPLGGSPRAVLRRAKAEGIEKSCGAIAQKNGVGPINNKPMKFANYSSSSQITTPSPRKKRNARSPGRSV